tara:strand:- start:1127 stop:1759 length:633 start_codon:yes stop_codon:yes gene_type:complete
MTYSVNEAFCTLQGEGANTGRAAVFCRFAGCNLWSGREKHRMSAVCQFCDTEFVGTDGQNGGRFKDASALAAHIDRLWAGGPQHKLVVLTGGEPLLQVDADLVDELRGRGFELAVETNGTVDLTVDLDWVCVSPKAGTELKVTQGQELKLVFPQPGLDLGDLQGLDFDHFYVQPMDGPDVESNTQAAVRFCLANPSWRLSLQTHKTIGIA